MITSYLSSTNTNFIYIYIYIITSLFTTYSLTSFLIIHPFIIHQFIIHQLINYLWAYYITSLFTTRMNCHQLRGWSLYQELMLRPVTRALAAGFLQISSNGGDASDGLPGQGGPRWWLEGKSNQCIAFFAGINRFGLNNCNDIWHRTNKVVGRWPTSLCFC